MLMSNSPNDSFTNIKRRNTRDIKSSKEPSKEPEIMLRKVKTSKRSINSMAKLQPKKNEKIKKNKNNEPRRTFYSKNSRILFSDRAQKNFLNIIKREKSADHLKKKSSSLRERIRQYFTEMGYFDTNFNLNYLNNKNRKISSSNKNYNTLILMKQNQKEENKKYYLSPEKNEQTKKNNFYKRLLNLRTVTGPKMSSNEVLLYNYKENYNINNNKIINSNEKNTTQYTSLINRNDINNKIEIKNDIKSKNNKINDKSLNNSYNINNNANNEKISIRKSYIMNKRNKKLNEIKNDEISKISSTTSNNSNENFTNKQNQSNINSNLKTINTSTRRSYYNNNYNNNYK
jgi:hypothetical protein